MKRYLFRDRRRRNRIILITIIMVSVLFLVRVFTLSVSEKIGQAKINMGTAIISNIYSGILESGSATIGYHIAGEKADYPFPINMASGICELHQYVSAGTKIRPDTDIKAVNAANKPKIYEREEKKFKKIMGGILTKEYILTNGAILNGEDFKDYIEASAALHNQNQSYEIPVKIMEGAIDYNEFKTEFGGEGGAIETMRSYNGTPFTLEQLNDVSFLVRNFYILDPSTRVTDELFDAKVLLEKDMTIKTAKDEPQILIYHTHSQEAFVDSRKGVLEDSVVGIGDLLTKILEEEYGYNVIHDRGVYDLVNGKMDRNKAYNYAREAVLKILDENPSIDVVIDIHRDALDKRSTYINGQETAQIMLFNGLSRDKNGTIERLDNPYLQDNLAFSLQLQLKSLEMYPGLFYRNYLQYLRYNLDVRPKSLLIELGTEYNTLKSAKNAMRPFAEILDAVLQGK